MRFGVVGVLGLGYRLWSVGACDGGGGGGSLFLFLGSIVVLYYSSLLWSLLWDWSLLVPLLGPWVDHVFWGLRSSQPGAWLFVFFCGFSVFGVHW